MTIAWVVGSSGLLGSALSRSLRDSGTELFIPPQRFSWQLSTKLLAQIRVAVRAFSTQVELADKWEIYWAAGVGTMSSSAQIMAPETEAMTLLLELLLQEPTLMAIPGRLIVSSSAGAIYAESTDEIFTENTLPTPTTEYALEKLKQERLVQGFIDSSRNSTALIARISTLYGQHQASGKKQGLLSHMARSIIRNRPIQIYVPFDTIRDYIHVDDAASVMINVSRLPIENSRVLTKIVASEYPATIAEIVGIFKRISRRTPLIVRSANKLSRLYSSRVQFRSIVHSNTTLPTIKRLPVGISQLMKAEHMAFVKSTSAERE